jgi:hypothetical protein
MDKSIKEGIRLGMCALVLTVTACSQEGAESPAGDTAASGEPSQRPKGNGIITSTKARTVGQQISGAVADLAARIGIEAETITVKQARAVSWGSSAMGCPEKDKSYTQAIVPGVLLFLEADGILYRYHGSTGSNLFYCPDERAVAPAYGPGQEVM